MPRYIDVDAFRMAYGMSERCEDCRSSQKECQYNDYSKRDFCGWLDDAPIVDAAPVVHGQWEEPQWVGIMVYDKRAYAQCSVCKEKSYLGWQDKYCRHCGSKNLEGG